MFLITAMALCASIVRTGPAHADTTSGVPAAVASSNLLTLGFSDEFPGTVLDASKWTARADT